MHKKGEEGTNESRRKRPTLNAELSTPNEETSDTKVATRADIPDSE